MIFSQYTETCEVLLDHPKTGGDDVIEDYAKMLSGTFYMQTLMYTAEDWLLNSQNMESNALRNYNHIVQTWLFLIKVDMTGPFNRSNIKEGNLQSNKSRGLKMHMLYQFQ